MLIKPRCGMEMQLCSLQRQLCIICFYLLKLHLKEMLLCVIWQKFEVCAPCSHFWDLWGSQTWVARDGGMGAWLKLNCCGITGCFYLHFPSPGYQNSCWPCHCKPTASAGLLFLLWTCSAPISQTGQVEKSKVAVVPIMLKHFSSLMSSEKIYGSGWSHV